MFRTRQNHNNRRRGCYPLCYKIIIFERIQRDNDFTYIYDCVHCSYFACFTEKMKKNKEKTVWRMLMHLLL